MDERAILLPLAEARLTGDLASGAEARQLVLFVHGSGSGRRSPRNRFVAQALQRRGCATLLFDLLTEREDQRYENRFDIEGLTARLLAVTAWVEAQLAEGALPIAYFGASTGAAAALNAAAVRGDGIASVVSRGGRPDLALEQLPQVRAPTLLIVGGKDTPVIALNEKAQARLRGAPCRLHIVPGATHLFEEPGALEQVARLAGDWIVAHAPVPTHG